MNPTEHRLFRSICAISAFSSLLIAGRADAAPKKAEHTLGVSLGYADYGVADRAATALVYRGDTGLGRFEYIGERARLRWHGSVGFAMGPYRAAHHPDRTAVFGTLAVDGATEDIEVPIRGRTMVPTASLGLDGKWSFGRLTLLVGGALDYELFYPQGFVTPGLMQSLSFRPSLRLRVDASASHRFELGVTTPLAAWVVRMPYHQSVSVPGESPVGGLVRLGSRFQGPNTLQGIGVDLRYRWRIGRRVGLTARYQFAWLRNELPRLLSRADQQLSLGVEVYL